MDRATRVLIACLALGPALPMSGQADSPASVPAELQSDRPQLVRRCHTVALAIKSTTLAPAILRNDLRERGEFQDAGLVLTDQNPADVELTVSLPKLSAFAGRNDAEVRALRTADGVTATQQLLGFGSYEGMVAAKAIDVLHELCPTASTIGHLHRLSVEPLEEFAASELQLAHTLAVHAQNSRVDTKLLQRSFTRQAEFGLLDITISPSVGVADVRLEVENDAATPLTWRYEAFDREGRSLFVGYLAAFHEDSADVAIAESVILRLTEAKRRPHNVRANDAGLGIETRIWRARLVTDDPSTTMLPLEITVDRAGLSARNPLRQTLFNIRAADLEDIEYASERDPFLPYPSTLVDMAEGNEQVLRSTFGEDPKAIAAGYVETLAALVAYTAMAGITAPLQAREHFVDIVWSDDDTFRRATLQMSRRDAKYFVQALGRLREMNQPYRAGGLIGK